MKTYEYRGFDRSARSSRGLVEALGVKEAREKLMAMGVLAEHIEETDRQQAFRSEDRAALYRELGALLESGIPMVTALEHLLLSSEFARCRSQLSILRDSIREGIPPALAFERISPSVTGFEIAVIEAAERSASLDTVLARLAAFLEEQERIRGRVQGALIYPAIVVTVGVCVAILTLGFLLPRVQELASGGNMTLPLLTRVLMASGTWLAWLGVASILAVVVGAFFFRRRWKQDAAFRQRWDQRLFSMPVIGTGYRLLVNLRFAQTLGMLLQGGVPLVESMKLAGRATGSQWITELITVQSEEVRHGGKLSDAIQRVPPLAEALSGRIQIGEGSGGMVRLLASASQTFQERWERYISRMLSLIEPALILAIGVFVLLITLAVLQPIFTVTRSMGVMR
jgi:general secretion pathway protein F